MTSLIDNETQVPQNIHLQNGDLTPILSVISGKTGKSVKFDAHKDNYNFKMLRRASLKSKSTS